LSVRWCDENDRLRVVTSVTESSCDVVAGALFIARKGVRHDGRAHLGDATARGAIAVLVDDTPADPAPGAAMQAAREQGVAVVRSSDAARDGAVAIERFWAEPSRSIALVGVTGTNGKTTVAWLLRRLLDGAGVRCGLLSTVGIETGVRSTAATHTTPPASVVSQTLRAMLDAGCSACAMEASSHALAQRRVAGVQFRAGVFTNLSGDHLDYHGSMAGYADAKAALFAALPAEGVAVVNADDERATRMLRDCGARVIACSAAPAGANALRDRNNVEQARVRVLEADAQGAHIELTGTWGTIDARSPLLGLHNAMNLLQAVAVAHALGADAQSLTSSMQGVDAPPGRFERVDCDTAAGGQAPFTVFVDYAHTDDALVRALEALRNVTPGDGQLIVVFGAGGDRDATKRPRMGAVVERLADVAIVTSDNPRTEDPGVIIADVLAGMTSAGKRNATPIVDRAQAIDAAIAMAQEGDVVLIAGKGHEDYQVLADGAGGTVSRHFDDRETARSALAARFTLGAERVA